MSLQTIQKGKKEPKERINRVIDHKEIVSTIIETESIDLILKIEEETRNSVAYVAEEVIILMTVGTNVVVQKTAAAGPKRG